MQNCVHTYALGDLPITLARVMTTNEKHQTENNGHRHKVVGPKWPTSGGAARILMDDLLRDCHRLNGPVSITRLLLPTGIKHCWTPADRAELSQTRHSCTLSHSFSDQHRSQLCVFYYKRKCSSRLYSILSVYLSVPRPRLSWSHILTSSPGFPFRPASCLFSCPPFCFHSSNQYNYVLILHKF